jgi:capsular exopolysaccharide synthesis family protein
MISLTILGLIVGGVSWYFLRKYAPKYTARTYIRVLPPMERDPMVIGGGAVAKDIQYGHRLSLAALMKGQRTLEELLDRDKIRKTEWFGHFGKSKAVSIRKAVKDLKKRLGVSAERDAEFISVSMTCGDKIESALIVNEMVSLFIASQGSTKKAEVTERLARLEDQRVRLQRDLTSAEDALDDVRKRWGFGDLEEREFQHTVTLKLNRLEFEQDDLLLEMRQIQASIETLERQATGPINEQIERQIEADPIMLALAQQLAFQQAALAARLTKFGENHRAVREMRELISKTGEERLIRRSIIAEQTRQSNLKNAQDMQTVLQSRLEELEKMREEAATKKRDLDAARVQYEQRVSIRDERKEMLSETKGTIETLKVMHDDPETPKVQFVGQAPVPLEVSSPKWQLYFPGGTMLGLMLGAGLAFLIELLNDLVRMPRDVSRYLNIPLLGVIPDAAEDEQLRGIDRCLIVRQAPYSIVSESYRRFRANLKLSDAAETSKALLVSSGMAGDGKTSLAVNLATTFVAENKKILLIDANFWRPNLHKIFPKRRPQDDPDEPSEFGLSTLLVGLCGYQEIIRPSGIEGLDVIDVGPLPSNPAELLGAAQMEQLLKHQRENYDYVIVDGPPVLLVSDTKVLAKLVDATILVFNAGATRRGAAQRTIRELREVNAGIVGCVLLAVRAMKGGYFHEQFRSYQEYQQLQLAHSI